MSCVFEILDLCLMTKVRYLKCHTINIFMKDIKLPRLSSVSQKSELSHLRQMNVFPIKRAFHHDHNDARHECGN